MSADAARRGYAEARREYHLALIRTIGDLMQLLGLAGAVVVIVAGLFLSEWVLVFVLCLILRTHEGVDTRQQNR